MLPEQNFPEKGRLKVLVRRTKYTRRLSNTSSDSFVMFLLQASRAGTAGSSEQQARRRNPVRRSRRPPPLLCAAFGLALPGRRENPSGGSDGLCSAHASTAS